MMSERRLETEWARDRIEGYLDGDLAGEDLLRFERELETSFALREELAQAQKTLAEIRALPRLECPDRVTERIYRATVDAPRGEREPLRGRFSFWGWPSLGFAACAAALLVVLSLNRGPFKGPAKALAPVYTEAEIEQAEQQLRSTFAYLAGVGVRTGAFVGEEVLRAGFVRPVRETARAIGETKLMSQVVPNEKEEG